MATKKYLELQEYSDADLANEVQSLETQYQKLRFDHAIKGLDNPLVLREARRRQLAKMTAEELANRSKIRARRRRK